MEVREVTCGNQFSPFYHEGPDGQTQDFNLACKGPYLLSHLARLKLYILKHGSGYLTKICLTGLSYNC